MTLLMLFSLVVQSVALPAPKLWGVKPYATNEAYPAQSIEWVQDAPSMDAIWRYIYRVYYDKDKTGGKQLGGRICTGSYSPFTCSAQLPAFTTTAGTHTVTLTVALFISGDSVQYPSQTGPESWSNPAEFKVRQPPPQMYIATPYGPPPVVIK